MALFSLLYTVTGVQRGSIMYPLGLNFRRIIEFCIFFLAINNHVIVGSESLLEKVKDNDLVSLIQSEKYVISLFANESSPKNLENEKTLSAIQEELVDTLSTSVVKLVNSPMAKLYCPKTPCIVFFRHGVALLYAGSQDEEEMLSYFVENKEPLVRELTDETFEHLTQASSGATTGDWFVMFYSDDCVECQRMGARWEAVGAKVKQRINVAKVNKGTTGISTARRFNVQKAPEFIFFRLGKMYRYGITLYDVNSFVLFTQEWYKNVYSEKVPVPQSPFDEITQTIADFLKSNPWIMKLGSMCICIIVIVTTVSKLSQKTEATAQKKDK